MPTSLRIEMILLAVLFIAIVVMTVNKKRLLLKYSLIWLFVSLGMILAALFPEAFLFISDLMGIEKLSNFIYLVGMIVLLSFTFSLTVILSKQAERTKSIIQKVSIQTYLYEKDKKQ